MPTKTWLVVMALAAAGCDQASFQDCLISCTVESGCPSGFTCGAEGVCRANGVTATCDEVLQGALVPSNGLRMSRASGIDKEIVVDGGIATFNTDTGAIDGVLSRAAGTGGAGGIGFEVSPNANAEIGVFTFHRLVVGATGTIRFT